MSVDALYDAANELLIAASEACALTDAGPMDQVFVSPGPPAWDCPNQLTVHAGGANVGDTLPLQPPLQPMRRVDQGGMGRQVNLVQFTIVALRCAPAIEHQGEVAITPTGAEQEQAAKSMLQDLWAIWNHLATRKRDGTLFAPHTREFMFDPAVPLAVSGGVGGWQIQVRVQVDGYST